jgi:prepilin-type N-terminal cleavage/methylation domain-containing protein
MATLAIQLACLLGYDKGYLIKKPLFNIKLNRRAVTLMEILIVVIIVGILVTMSMPLFEKTKERGLDKEAITNLRLVQSAERIYAMETGTYLSCGNTDCINDNMRLSIPAGANPNWTYTVNTAGSAFTIRATRNNPPAGWARQWQIDHDDEDPSCPGCP